MPDQSFEYIVSGEVAVRFTAYQTDFIGQCNTGNTLHNVLLRSSTHATVFHHFSLYDISIT